jgi:hypothetical protein
MPRSCLCLKMNDLFYNRRYGLVIGAHQLDSQGMVARLHLLEGDGSVGHLLIGELRIGCISIQPQMDVSFTRHDFAVGAKIGKLEVGQGSAHRYFVTGDDGSFLDAIDSEGWGSRSGKG